LPTKEWQLKLHCVSNNNYQYHSYDSASSNTANHYVTYTFKRLLQQKPVIDSFHAAIRDMVTQMDKYINTNSD